MATSVHKLAEKSMASGIDEGSLGELLDLLKKKIVEPPAKRPALSPDSPSVTQTHSHQYHPQPAPQPQPQVQHNYQPPSGGQQSIFKTPPSPGHLQKYPKLTTQKPKPLPPTKKRRVWVPVPATWFNAPLYTNITGSNKVAKNWKVGPDEHKFYPKYDLAANPYGLNDDEDDVVNALGFTSTMGNKVTGEKGGGAAVLQLDFDKLPTAYAVTEMGSVYTALDPLAGTAEDGAETIGYIQLRDDSIDPETNQKFNAVASYEEKGIVHIVPINIDPPSGPNDLYGQLLKGLAEIFSGDAQRLNTAGAQQITTTILGNRPIPINQDGEQTQQMLDGVAHHGLVLNALRKKPNTTSKEIHIWPLVHVGNPESFHHFLQVVKEHHPQQEVRKLWQAMTPQQFNTLKSSPTLRDARGNIHLKNVHGILGGLIGSIGNAVGGLVSGINPTIGGAITNVANVVGAILP